jgi:hypothetical protein
MPRVNPNAHYGLLVIIMCQCRFIAITDVALWCGMMIMGEAICVGCGVRRHGRHKKIFISFYPLIFAVSAQKERERKKRKREGEKERERKREREGGGDRGRREGRKETRKRKKKERKEGEGEGRREGLEGEEDRSF